MRNPIPRKKTNPRDVKFQIRRIRFFLGKGFPTKKTHLPNNYKLGKTVNSYVNQLGNQVVGKYLS